MYEWHGERGDVEAESTLCEKPHQQMPCAELRPTGKLSLSQSSNPEQYGGSLPSFLLPFIIYLFIYFFESLRYL